MPRTSASCRVWPFGLKCLRCLNVFSLRVTVGTRVYIHGVFPDPGNDSFQQKVNELTKRQDTASKKQAHVATKLSC